VHAPLQTRAGPAARTAAPLLALALALTATLTTACASIGLQERDWSAYDGPGAEYFGIAEPPPPEDLPDPIQPVNRVVGEANQVLLTWVARPLSAGWRAVSSRGVRDAFVRFGTNLAYPVRAVNRALQGGWSEAGTETARFLINSTVGLLGFFDPAADWWSMSAPEAADTGQTFDRWGWEPRAFVMLPVLGPSSDRDAAGLVVDTLLNPAFWIGYGLGGALFFNAGADQVEGLWQFTQVEADPYSWSRVIWTLARTERVQPSPTVPMPDDPSIRTLGAVFLAPTDKELLRKVEQCSIRLEHTGQDFPYTLRWRPEPAPLLVVLPGIGGHRLGNSSLAFVETAWEEGASVLTISSPFNHEFMRTAATVALPGDGPSDAHDTHVALDAIVRALEREHPGRITARWLGGLSMGAYHALLIGASGSGTDTGLGLGPGVGAGSDRSPDRDLVRFDLTVAVNPPVDLFHGMLTLDRFYRAPLRWPEAERSPRLRMLMSKVFELARSPDLKPGAPLPLSPIEADYLIGLAYRVVLKDVIWISQERADMGVLKTPRSRWDREAAYREIWEYSWAEYFHAFVLPSRAGRTPTEADAAALLARNDLHAVADALARDDTLRVVINEDDFLLRPGDVEWLRSVMGAERVIAFPKGGHLGNLYRPDVRAAIREGLRDVLPTELPRDDD
jgi:ABC-type transporter lipoprotein component MlaA